MLGQRKQDIVKQPCHISPTAATHALPQPLQSPHYKLRLKCLFLLYICFSYLPEKGRQEQVVKDFTGYIVKTRLWVWLHGSAWRYRHDRLYILTAVDQVEKHIGDAANTCVQRQLVFCI